MKSLKNRIKDAENKLKKINPDYQKIQEKENNIQESSEIIRFFNHFFIYREADFLSLTQII